MMDKQLNQAVIFFKRKPAYDRLFILFRKKYKSLGRIGGTISTAGFTSVELEEFGGFFGVPSGQLQVKGSISLKLFDEQLENTRFNKVKLKTLLDAYFGYEILSNKEHQVNRDAMLRHILVKQRERYPILTKWVDYLLEMKGEGRWILRLAEHEPVHFERVVGFIATAVSRLPLKAERLPMFSQRITGDPHAFDSDQELGKMLIHVLSVQRMDSADESVLCVPTDTEGVNELLNEYHLYRDDLLNFVTASGLFAETDLGKNKIWEAAVKHNTVQLIPLRELVKLNRVYPACGKKIWIVENSGVCSVLLDHKPEASLVCTNGQFTLASLILLDLLVKEGCELHYAGDFDPEGLSMAERLLFRYPEQLTLWRMDKEAYKASRPVKIVSKERLEKLNSITHDKLVDVASDMRLLEKAGYQEALVDLMIADLEVDKE